MRRLARIMALAMSAVVTTATTAPRIVFAEGTWASFQRGSRCEAVNGALNGSRDRSTRAILALLFDRQAGARGQLVVKLGRPMRPGGTVMLTIGQTPFLLLVRPPFAWSRGAEQEAAIVAALRGGGPMRVEAGGASGRFVDRYSADGAAGAMDAAAACAARS